MSLLVHLLISFSINCLKYKNIHISEVWTHYFCLFCLKNHFIHSSNESVYASVNIHFLQCHVCIDINLRSPYSPFIIIYLFYYGILLLMLTFEMLSRCYYFISPFLINFNGNAEYRVKISFHSLTFFWSFDGKVFA